MEKTKVKPQLSENLFWDCYFNQIDYDDEKSLVIERVLTRGKDKDVYELFRYYGSEVIKNEVLKLRYLDKKTLNYCSIIFNLRREDFRCYRKTQSKDPFGMF